MKVIYISSPYTKGDQGENVGAQINALHRIMDLGGCPIAPLIYHYAHITRPRSYEEWMAIYEEWMAIDLELVRRADAVLRLPGESAGADREVELAMQLGKPVFTGWDSLKTYLIVTK